MHLTKTRAPVSEKTFEGLPGDRWHMEHIIRFISTARANQCCRFYALLYKTICGMFSHFVHFIRYTHAVCSLDFFIFEYLILKREIIDLPKLYRELVQRDM